MVSAQILHQISVEPLEPDQHGSTIMAENTSLTKAAKALMMAEKAKFDAAANRHI
jgi:hypothetical protein